MRLRRAGEQRIFFPWENRDGLLRRFRSGRVRPLLIGLAVIGFVVLVGARERRRAGIRQTRATLLDARAAVDSYMAAHDGGCPEDMGEVASASGFERPFRDAWGRQLRLSCPSRRQGSAYDLTSDGPDGKPGGLDRIQ
jgi:general secretion pathway protein G